MANSNWKWAVGGALVLGLIGASCRDNRSEIENGDVRDQSAQQKREQSWNPGGTQGSGSFDSTRGMKTLGNDQGTQTQGWGNREGTGGSGSDNQSWNGDKGTGHFPSTAETPTLPGPVRDDGQQQQAPADHHNETR